MSTKTLNRIMFVMAIAGIIIAAYVTQSFVRGVGIVCVNSGCELVRKSPVSYIAGIPVPAFGLVGYTLLAILLFLHSTFYDQKSTLYHLRSTISIAIMAIAAGGVAFIAWFTYMEIAVIKAICTWCAISGVNMTLLFLLSIKSFTIEKSTR